MIVTCQNDLIWPSPSNKRPLLNKFPSSNVFLLISALITIRAPILI